MIRPSVFARIAASLRPKSLSSTACSAAILAVLPSVAFADGNGIMAPFITWFQGNFALGIVVLAVLFCGVAFMAGVRNWMMFVGVAVGALVVSNASTIAGVLYTQN